MSNARNLARLLPNTSGQLPDANLAAIAAGKVSGQLADANMSSGSVLQVVQGTLSTSYSITSGSYVDFGLTATITPTSSSSKILVLASISTASSNAGTGKYIRLFRNSTNIGNGGWGGGGEAVAIGDYCPAHSNSQASHSYTYLDNPATGSAITYKFQARVTGATLYINRASSSGSGAYAEPLSSITLMEIAA